MEIRGEDYFFCDGVDMCGDVESDMTWISCGGGGDVFCS